MSTKPDVGVTVTPTQKWKRKHPLMTIPKPGVQHRTINFFLQGRWYTEDLTDCKWLPGVMGGIDHTSLESITGDSLKCYENEAFLKEQLDEADYISDATLKLLSLIHI